MSLSLRVFPLLPDKEPQFHAFCEELAGPRFEQVRDFYERFGVVRETWMLQHTRQGTSVVVCSQMEHRILSAFIEYGASQHEFDQWFKGKVLELSGIDVNSSPMGPPTELAYDWHAGRVNTRGSVQNPSVAE